MASDEIGSFASRRQRVAVVMAERFDGLNLTQLAKLQAMVHALQRLTRDASITTVELEEGRMRLTLEGTERAIEQLRQLFANGELAEALALPVRAVEPIVSDGLNSEEIRGMSTSLCQGSN